MFYFHSQDGRTVGTVARCRLQHVSSRTRLFLSRVSILTRDTDIANLSVRPSIGNVPVSDENGLTYGHSFFTVR